MNRIIKGILCCPLCQKRLASTSSMVRAYSFLSGLVYRNKSAHLLSNHGSKASPNVSANVDSLKLITADYLCKELYTTQVALSKDEDDNHPSLQVMISETASVKHKTEHVIAGKGPPPEPPTECCMSGCANCLWIQYAEDVKNYYQDGGERAREHIEKIENPSLKAFVMFELGMN